MSVQRTVRLLLFGSNISPNIFPDLHLASSYECVPSPSLSSFSILHWSVFIGMLHAILFLRYLMQHCCNMYLPCNIVCIWWGLCIHWLHQMPHFCTRHNEGKELICQAQIYQDIFWTRTNYSWMYSGLHQLDPDIFWTSTNYTPWEYNLG